ncbi:hypothetical protein [Aquitalea pelogenes]|mgnify:CR=1 FL=1|uniref:hypothetical protein n=1 Tax=Aquitalea pelogenes TaxID=1293573 RepID=UPI00293688BD|nr:hypothetical protein [Raoultella ornithinolytica]
MEMFSVEQMQAAQQLNQEALGSDGFAQYNALIQKSTIFAMPLNKDEQKQLAEFQSKISAHRKTKEREPKKQEFIKMVEVMKSLGFKPAELKSFIAGGTVTAAATVKPTFTLGTFNIKDFGEVNGVPADVTTYTVVVGNLPRLNTKGWEVDFIKLFNKDAEKVLLKMKTEDGKKFKPEFKEAVASLLEWEPMKKGNKPEYANLTAFLDIFGIKDDKTKKLTKEWVAKLGDKYPTEKDVEAKKKALEEAKKVAVEEALA